MLNSHWAVSKRDHSDWLFSLVNQCIRRKNESDGSKQIISYSANIEGSNNFTPSIYLTIPMREYFHEDMAVWNVESEDQLIKIHIQNGKHQPTQS